MGRTGSKNSTVRGATAAAEVWNPNVNVNALVASNQAKTKTIARILSNVDQQLFAEIPSTIDKLDNSLFKRAQAIDYAKDKWYGRVGMYNPFKTPLSRSERRLWFLMSGRARNPKSAFRTVRYPRFGQLGAVKLDRQYRSILKDYNKKSPEEQRFMRAKARESLLDAVLSKSKAMQTYTQSRQKIQQTVSQQNNRARQAYMDSINQYERL